MLVGLFSGSKKKRTAQRAMALLLLSISLFDLTIIDLFAPGLCEGEGTTAAVAQAATDVSKAKGSNPGFSDETGTQHRDSSEPSALEEDCFCCCAHILPSDYFRIPALPLPPERVVSISALLPSSPPLEMYHPPRIA